MKNKVTCLILGLLFAFVYLCPLKTLAVVQPETQTQGWTNIGNVDPLLSSSIYSIDFSGDIPYMATNDSYLNVSEHRWIGTHKLKVFRFENNNWIPIGVTGSVADQAYSYALTIYNGCLLRHH